MPSCLHSEMLIPSGRSGSNSMIWRRIVAVNVFGTSHLSKSTSLAADQARPLLPVNDVVRDPVSDVLSEVGNDLVRDHIPMLSTGVTITRYLPGIVGVVANNTRTGAANASKLEPVDAR